MAIATPRPCEIVMESRPVRPDIINSASYAVCLCRTHGITVEGYMTGPLCPIGRIEKLEAAVAYMCPDKSHDI